MGEHEEMNLFGPIYFDKALFEQEQKSSDAIDDKVITYKAKLILYYVFLFLK